MSSNRLTYGYGVSDQALFPTPVRTVLDEETCKFAKRMEGVGDFTGPTATVAETLIKRFLLDHSGGYANTLRGGAYVPDRMWVNVQDKGVWDSAHSHPGSYFVGVLYVQAPAKGGDLILIDPRGGFASVGFADEARGNGDNRRTFMRLTPTQGLIVYMPGYLIHQVEPNCSDERRVSVGVNFRRAREVTP
jgi:hypothetical protein